MSVSDVSSNNDFLQELDSNVYIDVPVLSEKELQKKEIDSQRQMKKFVMENERAQKLAEKQQIKNEKNRIAEEKKLVAQMKKDGKNKNVVTDNENEDTNSLFNEKGTIIQGRNKLMLMKKVVQYKSVFKDELKAFKIKKDANEKELETALIEMQTIIEIGSVDSFLMDSILQIVKVIESTSSLTPYDVSGLSVILNQNKEFSRLTKMLFLKYGFFNKIPIEMSIVLLVGTSSMLCINKNKNKDKINQFLDEKIDTMKI